MSSSVSHWLPTAVVLPLFAVFIVGCSHSEYDLLQPPEFAQHIGTKQTVIAPMPPLEYRMLAYEDHLVLRIYNTGDQTIQLLSGQSTVVDPSGQSHPLPVQSQMILPGSYIKLILPPARGRVVPSGPTIGIGFGGVFTSGRPYYGRGYGYGLGYAYDPFYDVPRYYAVYNADQSLYWSWADGGNVRLVLVYRRATEASGAAAAHPTTAPSSPPPGSEAPATFTHEFVFRQKSV